MSEARMGKGHWFFIGSTLTPYLRHHEVFEEETDYRLQLTLGATTATLEHLVEIDERFPLSYYATILCKQGEAFSEPLDDDMPKSEPEPHEEPASEEEAEAAAQAS
ncbi:hypothetical protein K7X08_030914 [Anisodus acutangulus]|uniref:Uncharacterized protein n=1 Tax=Anisodus acutangulus TaxID=402998 RepID=A0A9Q1M3G6_9SOLA|nr:hypothetical protein K7X08_030914 [Anisodus acutangulus]